MNTPYRDIDDLEDLPHLDEEADHHTDPHDKVGLIVHDVEHNDEWLEHVEEHRAHRQTLQRLAIPPELDVWKRDEGWMSVVCRILHSSGYTGESNLGFKEARVEYKISHSGLFIILAY